jgi:periplasmic divalent cation tolerance protein
VKKQRVPVLISTTTATMEEARAIASRLVEEQLAACVQIVDPITSVYTWQGNIEDEREVLLLIKSTQDLVSPVADLLDRIHPYEVPELIVTPIVDGSTAYLSWLGENLR